ncbi:hypothetical protein LEMLEM_LOCUS19023 [Lemmus lemmus]
MGSASVCKDQFHLHPVWKTFLKSCLQTSMALFILAMGICRGGPDKVSSSSMLSSLSGPTRPVPIRREAGSSSLMWLCPG